jgi:outer membrane protein TolC
MNVHEQVITSYYFALLSHEAIVLNQDLVNSGDSLLSAAEVRFSNGLIELLELNRVKSLYLESLQQLRESEGAYQKNLNVLKSLCGLHSSDTLVLTESIRQRIQESYLPTLLTTSFLRLPRHKMLSAKMFQAQEDLRRQRVKIFPELSAYARVSRQSFSDEFNFSSNTQPWYDVAVAGIRAEWNLFSGFNRQSNITQASLQLQIARNELDNYSLQAEKDLEELKINHQVAAHGVTRFLEHYRLNATNYRIAGEKYKQGIYTIDQYVTIYQETVRSQNQYLGKLANYMVYESMVNSKNALQ